MGVHICVCARIYTPIQTHQRVHTMHPHGATYVNARPDVGTRICESQHTLHAYVCTPAHNACAHTCTCTSGHAHTDRNVHAYVHSCPRVHTPTYMHPCSRTHARTHCPCSPFSSTVAEPWQNPHLSIPDPALLPPQQLLNTQGSYCQEKVDSVSCRAGGDISWTTWCLAQVACECSELFS